MGLEWKTLKKLKDVQEISGKTLEEMLKAVDLHLHTEPYTKLEVAQLLGLDVRLNMLWLVLLVVAISCAESFCRKLALITHT